MADEAELYAAVLADPDDDARRRALAAHYDLRGDPRGELIRLQLEIDERGLRERPGQGPRADPVRRAEAALLAEHGPEWTAPLADLVDGQVFHRGLVGEVTLPVDRFRMIDRLLELAPIQHVNLTVPADDLQGVLRNPHLRRLTTLSLAGLGLDDLGAVAFARNLAGLPWLSLARNRIGRTGVEALAASPWLSGAEVIVLRGNPCDPVPRTSTVYDYGMAFEDYVTVVDRPAVGTELWYRYRPRWLALPDDPENWPPGRLSVRRPRDE